MSISRKLSVIDSVGVGLKNQLFNSFKKQFKWIGVTLVFALATKYLVTWSTSQVEESKPLENNVQVEEEELKGGDPDEKQEDLKENVKIVTTRTNTPTGSHVTCFVASEDIVDKLIANDVQKEDEKEHLQETSEPAFENNADECELPPLDASAAFLLEKVEESIDSVNWDRSLSCEKWEYVKFDSDMEYVSLDLSFVPRYVNGSGMKFDILDMSPFLGESLTTLILEGCGGVTGSIKVLAQCPNLETVLLSLTALVGDISVFENCPRLKHLSLGSRRGRVPINGDIYVFMSCPELVSVKFFSSVLHGSIKVFSFTPKLENLNITKSNIDGDIAAFTRCPKLKSLTLSLTKVNGSIGCMSECKELTRLNLRGATEVTGSKQDLETPLPNCEVIA